MRPESQRMKTWLKNHGIIAQPKYIRKGSMKGTWRLYNLNTTWTEELANKLNGLGFNDFDHKPLGKYSGNGGRFSVFVRGHECENIEIP